MRTGLLRTLALSTLLLGLLASLPAFPQGTLLVSNVRKIYIEKMADNLDQYLGSAISEKFHGGVVVVLDRHNADAILRGINIGAQTTQSATVQLVDPSEKQVLWSGTAGDRKMLALGLAHGGQQKLADSLIAQLKKAMQH